MVGCWVWPATWWVVPLGTPDSYSEEPRKIPYGLWLEKGKIIIVKYVQRILLNKRLLSRAENFTRVLSYLGGHFPSSLPALPNWGAKLRHPCDGYSQGHRPTKKLKFNHKIIKYFLSSIHYHHTNRASITLWITANRAENIDSLWGGIFRKPKVSRGEKTKDTIGFGDSGTYSYSRH